MNWLLLRGLLREQRHWGDFPERFARELNVQVSCLDLPGTGTENNRSSPFLVSGIAEDLRSRWLVLKEQKPGPWSLFALSLGSMAALSWIDRHPGDFKRLVLVNPSAARLSSPLKRLHWTAIPAGLRAVMTRDPVKRERRILDLISSVDEGKDLVAQQWATYHGESRPRRDTVLRQLLAAVLFEAPGEIAIPGMILSGKGDRFVHPDCSRVLAEKLKLALKIHPTAGHDLSLDDPAWIVRQLQDWA